MTYDPFDHEYVPPKSNHPGFRPELDLNIFHLDPDPEKCAQYHVDTHVGKLFIEACQMLSTAVRHVQRPLEPELNLDSFYQASHQNHPMNLWVRSSYSNWYGTLQLAIHLSKEYTYRFFKIHATHYNCLNALLDDDVNVFMHRNLPYAPTQFPLCMPEHYKFYDDPYWCYRAYYKFGKSNLHYWTRRTMPEWMDDIPSQRELYGR